MFRFLYSWFLVLVDLWIKNPNLRLPISSVHNLQVLGRRPDAAQGRPEAAPGPGGEAAAAVPGRPEDRRADPDSAGAETRDSVRVADRQAGGGEGEGRRQGR